MTALLSPARYTIITGDATSASATAASAIEEATQLLAEELRRTIDGVEALTEGERTERLWLDQDRAIWPTATPVTVLPDGYVARGNGIYGTAPSGGLSFLVEGPDNYIDLTYTGGWTANTVPACVARDIAFAAYRIMHASALVGVPAGATSVTVGDVAVGYGSGGAPSAATPHPWSAATLRYRRRFV